jgi:hypothetical protein
MSWWKEWEGKNWVYGTLISDSQKSKNQVDLETMVLKQTKEPVKEPTQNHRMFASYFKFKTCQFFGI